MESYTQAVVAAPTRTRLAELVATISLGTDLGLGQPMQHVIRQTIIALEAGRYVPSLLLAFRIARVFDVTVDDLFHWNGKR